MDKLIHVLVTILLVEMMLPLGLGMWLRHSRPGLAERLQKPANSLCTVLSVLVIGLILYAQFGLLAGIRLRGYAGMLALLVASLGIGWLLGGGGLANRKTMALTTSLRNAGVALVIVTQSFPDTAAVTAVVAFGLFGVFGSVALALVWGWYVRPPG